MYEGRTSFEQGRILGHENTGEVVEIGSGVERVKVGDYVCLPFNVGCGFARIVKRSDRFCLTTNPGTVGAAYGFAEMGSGRVVRRNCFGSPLQTLTAGASA